MNTSKVVSIENKEHLEEEKMILTAEEKKRLTDFFAVLMEIDQRLKRKEVKNNEKV